MDQQPQADDISEVHGRTSVRFGLSGKLLLLTVIFVMLAEVLVYVPSAATFQRYEIENRLHSAEVAATTLARVPDGPLPRDLQSTVLDELGVLAIAVQKDNMKQLVAMVDNPPEVSRDIAIADMTMPGLIGSTFDTLLFGGDRTVRASGPYAGGQIEIVFSESQLRDKLIGFSSRLLLVSILISTFTAVLVYFSIRHLLVGPMMRLGWLVERWSRSPESPEFVVQPSGRHDELGKAEVGVNAMQLRVQDLLKQQRRLAELGLAVSKINHDLRNLLASAQLVSDRLSMIPDPTVQRFTPKLVSAIDRAIDYCQSVLAYGRAQEPPPARRLLALRQLVADVADVVGLTSHAHIQWINAVAEDLEIDADADQMFRVLMNLVRNAVQALEQSGDGVMIKRLTIEGERKGGVVRILVIDTGPGLPEKARQSLFKPFQGSARRGGTGLGLAIAAELVRAHGGGIAVLDAGPGATFEIEIPDRPVALAQSRRASRTG